MADKADTMEKPGKVTVLVGTTRGAFFFHSDAKRQNWEMTGPHLDGWEIYSLCGLGSDGSDNKARPENGGDRIFAGTSHFVYGPTICVSEDLGETWTQVEGSPRYGEESGFTLNRIWQIVPGHPTEPDTLYAGVDEAGLFVSRDGGVNMERGQGPDPALHQRAVGAWQRRPLSAHYPGRSHQCAPNVGRHLGGRRLPHRRRRRELAGM